MTGAEIVLSEAATGEVSTHPIAYAGAGILGVGHRYIPALLSGTAGDFLTTIPDTIGAVPLVNSTSTAAAGTDATRPTLALDGTEKVIRFEATTVAGDADWLSGMALIPVADMKAVTVILKLRAAPAAGATMFRAGGGSLVRAADGAINFTKFNRVPPAGSSATSNAQILKSAHPDCDPVDAYRCITVIGEGGDATTNTNALAVNGTFQAMAHIPYLRGNESPFTMGGINMPMDILEIQMHTRILVKADTDAIYAQAKINHPGKVT